MMSKGEEGATTGRVSERSEGPEYGPGAKFLETLLFFDRFGYLLGLAASRREKERETGQRAVKLRSGRRSRSSRADRGASSGSASEMDSTTSVATPAHINFRRGSFFFLADAGVELLPTADGVSCVPATPVVATAGGGPSGVDEDEDDDDEEEEGGVKTRSPSAAEVPRWSDARCLRPFLRDTRLSISTGGHHTTRHQRVRCAVCVQCAVCGVCDVCGGGTTYCL